MTPTAPSMEALVEQLLGDHHHIERRGDRLARVWRLEDGTFVTAYTYLGMVEELGCVC